MSNAKFTLPQPINEPILSYAPGSPERQALKAALNKIAGEQIEIPLIIGGKEILTGQTAQCVMRHDALGGLSGASCRMTISMFWQSIIRPLPKKSLWRLRRRRRPGKRGQLCPGTSGLPFSRKPLHCWLVPGA